MLSKIERNAIRLTNESDYVDVYFNIAVLSDFGCASIDGRITVNGKVIIFAGVDVSNRGAISHSSVQPGFLLCQDKQIMRAEYAASNAQPSAAGKSLWESVDAAAVSAWKAIMSHADEQMVHEIFEVHSKWKRSFTSRYSTPAQRQDQLEQKNEVYFGSHMVVA